MEWTFTFSAAEANVDFGTHELDIQGDPFTDGTITLRTGGTGVSGTKASPQVWVLKYGFGLT